MRFTISCSVVPGLSLSLVARTRLGTSLHGSVHWHCRKVLRVWYSQDPSGRKRCLPEGCPSNREGFGAENTQMFWQRAPDPGVRHIRREEGREGRQGAGMRSQADPHFSWEKPGAPEPPPQGQAAPWEPLRRFGARVPGGRKAEGPQPGGKLSSTGPEGRWPPTPRLVLCTSWLGQGSALLLPTWFAKHLGHFFFIFIFCFAFFLFLFQAGWTLSDTVLKRKRVRCEELALPFPS